MLNKRLSWAALVLVLAGYLWLGVTYAVRIPAWQSPDEPTHYNYVAQVAEAGCCPVIEMGDWDQLFLDEVKAAGFPPGVDLSAIEYEDHQPPLYYLLGAIIYRLTDGSLVALRLLSVVLGAGVVLMTYLAVARIFPDTAPLASAAAAFVAFLPQHIAMMASANNDSLAELILGLLLVSALAYVDRAVPVAKRPHAAVLGVLAGAAFLSKLTIYLPAILVVAVAILGRWRIERWPSRWLAGQIAWSAGLALGLGAIWWGRNVVVYGWPDFLAQAAHNAVVVGQTRTSERIAILGFEQYLWHYLYETFESFWGNLGWLALPLPKPIYNRIGRFVLTCLIGLAALAVFRPRSERLSASQRFSLGVTGASLAGTLANYVYWNLTFVQFQGRYLFTALPAISLIVVGGLWSLAWLGERLLPGAQGKAVLVWLPLATLLAWMPLLAFNVLNVYTLPNLLAG